MPLRTAVATLVAFVVAGSVPLVSYLIPMPQAWRFPLAAVLTGVTLFAIGAGRSLVTSRSWWRNGIEMLGVAAGAATIAWIVGRMLSGLTDSAAV